MKKRITKTKLLKHLTKLVDEAHGKYSLADMRKWKLIKTMQWERYQTLIEIRSFINDHKL